MFLCFPPNVLVAGITKTYELDCTSSEALNAMVDKDSYPTQVRG